MTSTCANLRLPSPYQEELVPEMRAIIEDPARFLSFCRLDAMLRFPASRNGWEWLCHLMEVYFMTFFFFFFLEHGFFVFAEGPLSECPEDSLYVVNLDTGLCGISLWNNRRTGFEMRSFPQGWAFDLYLPSSLMELAHAYTPSVKKKVVAEVEENLVLRLVLDSVAAPACESFWDSLKLLEFVQEFLFSGGDLDFSDLCRELGLLHLFANEELLEQKLVPLKLEELLEQKLVPLKLALLGYRDRIRWPYNEKTVSGECFEYLSKLAMIGDGVPGDLRELVVDGVKKIFRADRLRKLLLS